MSRRLSSPSRTVTVLINAIIAAVGRLDKSLSPASTLAKLRRYQFTYTEVIIYTVHILLAIFWLTIMEVPGFPMKLGIPVLFTIALLIPLTSQFFVPAIPVLSWVIAFYSSKFIPPEHRPDISVSLLPALESVLYGANISDILTRFTYPILDIIAWLPYGILHFALPFIVAIFLWLFRPKEALHFWAKAFGYLNLLGVIVQIILPCAAPWYELIYGLTPATYAVPGEAAGLARIDKLLGYPFYKNTFRASPVVFGAFPSLHAGNATIEALFVSHFFPWMKQFVWGYAAVLWWATMYLTHHYLIDVVCGACLAMASFYFFLPEELKGQASVAGPGPAGSSIGGTRVREGYDLETGRRGRNHKRNVSFSADTDFDSEFSSPRNSEEGDLASAYRSPNPAAKGLKSNAAGGRGNPVASVKKSHKHTASIASLIRAEDRVEDGWSPIHTAGFAFPPGASASQGNVNGSATQR